MGYFAGYKGWQFYNPITKKFIISERAEFDERYFPRTQMTTMNSIPTPTSLTFINGSDMPDLGDHHLNKNQSATSKISTSVISLPIYYPTPSSQSQSLQPPPPPSPSPQLPL